MWETAHVAEDSFLGETPNGEKTFRVGGEDSSPWLLEDGQCHYSIRVMG